ncbi:MAG: hypothetical protein DSY80_08535 [Desulfocapsa sp.]|nr:MAG: hypothetical protein DSY80_08535 [Desulfocapsa sp.]
MMDTEQSSESVSPFGEECNTARFFAGGGRGAVLDDMKVALAEQVDIITLIGEEGSGKSMLCNMLFEQLQNSYTIIFLPRIVGSFEAIVRVTAQKCNIEYPAETNRADARRIFLDLVTTLREQGKRILIISDEAENMYLATLERLRKILDDVKVDGGGLQLLFAGRKSFRTSLEQLAVCDFDEIAEKQFFLSTLDDNETWEYLNFCVQDSQNDTVQEIFTREAAGKIASMGRGNLRLINVFAEESLKSSNADTSFMVLLDHVRDDAVEETLLPVSKGFLDTLPFPPKFLLAGVAVALLFLLFVIFSGSKDEKQITKEKKQTSEKIITADVPKPILHSADFPPENTVVRAVDGVSSVFTGKSQEKETGSQATEETIEKQQDTVAISPVEIVEKKKIAVDTPQNGTQMRISADKVKHIISQPDQKIALHPPKVVKVKKIAPAKPSFSVAPVLANLVIAGDRWVAGKDSTGFSIQLMALRSEQAEENLERILSKQEYQNILSKLVILRKPSDPPAILVFYGLYPNMAAARNARNNLPIFLRDRHPYPVSVRGAVEKARL